MSQNLRTTFVGGKMNKSVDERLLPPGEYVDARNVRLGSTEQSEIGAVENSKGNVQISFLSYAGENLSPSALCIGAYEDGINETIYWFVHDQNHPSGKVDMIVSLNMRTNILTYHVVSISVLNFDPKFLITGVDKIDNLLFFTDDKNPPRRINVTKNYDDPAGGVDGIEPEDINVVKKPPGFEDSVAGYIPLAVPQVSLQILPGDENYITDRFLSFGYRYRYEDGEYSATSLFSQPAFQPSAFRINLDNYTNAGMINRFNSAIISFSTGSKRVVQVDLLYKESVSNQIYVIEKFKKADYGWSDNETQSFTFKNSKIYTLLGSDELLRLYDNVPHKAKAQTIQGNRLMYGNYVDQFDIDSSPGVPIQISYQTEPVTQTIGGVGLPTPTAASATYDINPAGAQTNIEGAVVFDLTDVPVPITQGTTFTFSIEVVSSVNVGIETSGTNVDASYKQNGGQPYDISWIFTASQDYSSVENMLNSSEFSEIIGTTAAGNFQPVATASNGVTLTDRFNATISPTIPNTIPDLAFINSGISGNCGSPTVIGNCVQQGFGLVVNGSTFQLTIPAVQYSDVADGGNSDQWEYFDINDFGCTVGYLKAENTLSLHSNRNYEVGVVYMDEYARASTVQVSDDNTVFFDSSTAVSKNNIKVTLNNPPPYWAKKYKFVVKPSEGTYNTVIVNTFYFDANDPQIYYFKLEGLSTSFVQAGDVLIVKSDTQGPVNTEIKATVLEVKAFASSGIPGNSGSLPGLYMLIKPGGFSTAAIPNANISYGNKTDEGDTCSNTRVNYSLSLPGSAPYTDYDLPAGSSVRIRIYNWRGSSGNNCTTKKYTFDDTFIVSQDYPNFYEWLVGDSINLTTGAAQATSAYQDFSQIYTSSNAIGSTCFQTRLHVWRDDPSTGGTNGLYFHNNSGIKQCSNFWGDTRPGHAETRIEVTRRGGLLVFETEPADADPNFFYDAPEAYEISGGNHQSGTADGDQDQDLSTGTPLKVTIANANCFTFSNGVESYKIEDLWTGKSFSLGERVLAVSNQDFSEADRFASMTYSGVIQPGANVNNLNEFNLGLVNYKDLESSFGPIMKLYSRETDILVLQEDRISYVLSGKNVITDSTGGGAIASVPEVLGTQIARIEEYGISFNPESFVSWGSSMFFTDVKRGAVLQLQGASANSDQLTVISEYGMRSWFRDQFLDQLETQKLGGYDPYMNEYVLCTNNRENISSTVFYDCGTTIEQFDATGILSYDIDFGNGLGDILLNYTVTSGTVDISFSWNGTTETFSTTAASSTGVLIIDKNLPAPTTATVTITPTSATATYEIQGGCPPSNEITVIKVVVNGTDTAGQFTTFGYSWTNGTYNSPLFSQQTELDLVNPSAYSSATGEAGFGVFPYDGVDLTMSITQTGTDNFVFNPGTNSFKYHTSNTLYTDSIADINTLLSLSTTVPQPYNNPSGDNYNVSISPFDIPSTDNYIYLIYDLRSVVENTLCYSTDINEACCACVVDCNTAYFGPQESTIFDVCNTNTNTSGSAQNSFYGSGNIPILGDSCFLGTECNVSTPLLPGYYIVDTASPAVSSPKNWIEVDQYGIVINTGTC